MTPVRTAVIPAAGLGTRLLPATKVVPKELLPVGGRPAIQHTVEEASAAGFDDIVLITSAAKHSVEDHFDPAPELERRLAAAGRRAELSAVRLAGSLARVRVVHQDQPLGLGHAVSLARRFVAGQSFAVLLPDELVLDGGALLRGLVDQHRATGRAMVGLVAVDPADIGRYGCAAFDAAPERFAQPEAGRIRCVVEKPDPMSAPSNLALCGRYVLGPDLFDRLARAAPDRSGEIQLSDALADLARQGRLGGVITRAPRYDLGRRLDYTLANLDLALADPTLGPDLRRHLDQADHLHRAA